MRIILTSPVGKRYMIQPGQAGLDFETYVENPGYGLPKTKGKNKGEISNQEWKSLGMYASNLPYTLRIVVDQMMRDPEENVVIKANVNDLKSIRDCIQQYLDRIVMEIKG